MKKITRFISTFTAALIMMSPLGTVLSVSAENTYNTVAGGTVEFEKYLVYDAKSNCPTAEFSFTIADGTAIAADKTNGKSAVYAGNSDPGVSNTAPVIYNSARHGQSGVTDEAKAFFDNTKTVYTTVQATESGLGQKTTLVNDPVDLTGGKAYSRDKVTVDFTGVTFSEPGVYRWVITETAMTSAQTELGFVADADPTRVLDVHVRDDGYDSTSGHYKLAIVGYVLHNNPAYQPLDDAGASVTPVEPDLAGDATKAIGYTNTYETHDLTITNTIDGNQASHDKYFKYTLTLADAGNATKLTVVTTNLDTPTSANAATLDAYETQVNPSMGASDGTDATTGRYIVTGSDGTLTRDFYLQHGQSITIQGLPLNAHYTVAEIAEDYSPSAVITGDTISGKTGSTAVAMTESAGTSTTTATVTDSDLTADTTIAFTNTRKGTIPTGVITSVLPGAAIAVLGIAGYAIIRKKNEEE